MRYPPEWYRGDPAALQDATLSDALYRTFARLRALAWNQDYRRLEPASMDTLAALVGKARSTLYGQLSELKHRGLLRWSTTSDGRLLIELAAPGRVQSAGLLNEEEDLTLDSGGSPPPHPPRIRSSRKGGVGENPAPVQRSGLAPHVREALAAAGVFPAKIDELAAAGVTEAQIAGHLADGAQGGILVYRLTHGVKPRSGATTVGAACPQCGRAAGHARDCGARYVTGEFAEYIEH